MLENMNITKKLNIALLFACLLVPALAQAEKILDKVEIEQTPTEADIHIEFQTQVRYLRHFPVDKEASRVQIYLNFPQYKTLPTAREFLNSPPSDLVPVFSVNFPDQKTNSIGVRFKKPVKFRVTPDSSGRGIILHVVIDKALQAQQPVIEMPAIEPIARIQPLGELPAKAEGVTDNDYAGKLVAESRVARGAGNYPKAIQLLNAALNLPMNAYSQEAQELIANTREKNGESAKAKAEYETYLKLYPQGEGAVRVQQRLAIIDAATKFTGATVPKAKKAIRDIHETTVYGSWNQYMYEAHTHDYDIAGNAKNHHDQSSLVSVIDLTARSRQNEYDSKLVFRNTQTMNFLRKGEDRDRTQAAYAEVINNNVDYLVRLGRQNGNTGGVLGRYDGAWLRYGITPKLRVNLVGGSLAEYKVDYKRHFYGVNFDIGPVNENWSGNAFFINQEVDHLTDRRAVGGELRYSDNGQFGRSFYSLIDYDTVLKQLNTAMFQGNWQTENGINYNTQIEQRKSPVLQLINGLQDPAFNNTTFYPTKPVTLRQALLFGQSISTPLTESELRTYAINQTIDTNLALFGATRQVTPRWQLGGDIQVSRVKGQAGASDGAIFLAKKAAAEAGTVLTALDLQNLTSSFANGNTWNYHVQAVGLDTLFKDDTSVISASYTQGPTNEIHMLLLSNVMVPREKWRLDSSLKLLRIAQDASVNSLATVQYVVSPTLRASYSLREKATIEAEVGVEVTNGNSSDITNPGHLRTLRDFSFIGYRLDL
jgi:tetratricopeptide (TPR) repeat protein